MGGEPQVFAHKVDPALPQTFIPAQASINIWTEAGAALKAQPDLLQLQKVTSHLLLAAGERSWLKAAFCGFTDANDGGWRGASIIRSFQEHPSSTTAGLVLQLPPPLDGLMWSPSH